MPQDSISHWIAQLRCGEAEAAQKLWRRYADQLVEVARRRLGDSPRAAADEEDIALSVFHSVCQGAVAGRFCDITDRNDLWWLLLTLARQKVIDHVRRETAQKRGAGRVRPEAAVAGSRGSRRFSLDHLIGDAPTPEYWIILQEEHQRLLGLLRDDCLRRIASRRIEGFSVAEIAEDLTISTRSVERKLRLIRGRWAQEFPSDEPSAGRS